MGLNVLSSNFLMTLRWMVQLLRHKEVMLSTGTWTSLRNEPTWKEWGSTCWSARCYSSVGAIADMSTDWMNNWEQLCGEKLVFLVNGKLQMSQECALAIWKAISDLESTEKGVASRKRELLVLFWPLEVPFGIMSTRKMWSTWTASWVGYKDGQRTGAPLLWTQAEKAGLVHFGEEKASGISLRPFST